MEVQAQHQKSALWVSHQDSQHPRGAMTISLTAGDIVYSITSPPTDWQAAELAAAAPAASSASSSLGWHCEN